MRVPGFRVAQAFLIAAVLILCARAFAQPHTKRPSRSITIYLVNGRTGRPMHNKTIRAQLLGSRHHTTIAIDSRGFGHLEVPAGVPAFYLSAAINRKTHKPAYTVCGPFHDLIAVKGILAHGYVPLDACSPTLKLRASPGVLIYFIQPLPWYAPARE